MKYSRQTIDPGSIADMLPGDPKLFQKTKLPEITFSKGGVKYTISDLRLLHPCGVQAVEYCLSSMLREKGITEQKLYLSADIDPDDLERTIDIVLGFSISAEKKGKNGYSGGCNPFIGVRTEIEDGGHYVLNVDIVKEYAEIIYDYGQTHDIESTIYINDLAEYVGSRIPKIFSKDLIKALREE